MGGRIWLESEEGRGSKFHFTTTVLRETAGESAGKTQNRETPAKGWRVLAVDDNPLDRDLLERLFTRWNIKTVLAASAEEALAHIAEAQRSGVNFSTILIEKDLRSLGGLALVATLRASPAADVPVILVHSRPLEAEERDRCRQLGLTRMISKPFRRSALYEALQSCHGEMDAAQVPILELPTEEKRLNLRILLAEDNLVNQRLISRLLEKMGHHVTIVSDGQMALRLSGQQQFDLVAMDMQMPVMDGVEATEEIRAREKQSGQHLPIVAMTANAFDEDRRRCEEAGMDGYVAKPLTSKTIATEIARVMTALAKDEGRQTPSAELL
jgi:CheY-like chemotaxis protein